ncbi:ribonuclease H-like domain-containing protein [Rhizophagus clarus]|uniref:Ribonuclease H-like domain-containing protein n=1 Tax=Rhizophagus clarus TaxID=94130 RepID=A0A8H3M739_9GLOM|nr:ribonuclease H-like domain-containing protein [Rhizophagus clarus]
MQYKVKEFQTFRKQLIRSSARNKAIFSKQTYCYSKSEAFANNNQQISHKKQKVNENSEQSQTKIIYFHESSKLSQERYHEITQAKAFVICGYMPPSRDNLLDELFAQEAAIINQQITKELKHSNALTLLCDGWTNAANESIWNFLIHMPDYKEYLFCLKNLSEESHTGVFLAKEIEDIIKQIGPKKFSAVVNTRWHTMFDCIDSIKRHKDFLEKEITTWWLSIEDNFPKEKDYLVQLALKLFSITPHTAQPDVEEFGLHSELPYYSIGKSNEEVHDDLMKENMLIVIQNEIIKDCKNSMEEEYVDIQDVDEMVENEYDIDWDPATEADK